MKKFLYLILLTLLPLAYVPKASAAPPTNELNQYLASIGWTKQDLMDYLNYYEIPLDEFTSVEDLKSVLGTPITANNLQALLSKYNLTQQQLTNLLNQFGDSLDPYKFIEDLDSAVAFYTNHDNYMAKIKEILSKIGITDAESEKFFGYLSRVEENNQNQLDQMQALDTRMEQFMGKVDPNQLTDQDFNELAQILTDSFNISEIQVKFKVNNQDITLKDLLALDKVPGRLYVAILSKTGDLLMDFTLPPEYFTPLTAGWEQLLHLGELSNELVDYLHNIKSKNGEWYK